MLYNPPTGSTDPNAPYIGKNTAAGIQGSKIPPAAAEFPQRELVAFATEAGISPTNGDLAQAMRATRSGQLWTFTDSSTTANAIVITPRTAHTALVKGLPFRIFPALTNTSATVTLTVGTTLTAPVKKRDGTSPAIGDLVANIPIDVVYNGSVFLVLGLVGSDVPAPAPVIYVGGDTSSNPAVLVVNSPLPVPGGYYSDRVYEFGAASTCPGGAVTINYAGLGPVTIVRNDGSALQPNDWLAGWRVQTVHDGTKLRLQYPTFPQIMALFNGSISTATQTYIDKSTPRNSTNLSAFTANENLSDISSSSFSVTQQTGQFSGATYVDCSATCAFRDVATTGTEGSCTARIGLVDVTAGTTTYSEYVVSGSYYQNTQISLVVPRFIYDLNPAHAYYLVLAVQKNAPDGQVETYDTYIFAQHDGTNSGATALTAGPGRLRTAARSS